MSSLLETPEMNTEFNHTMDLEPTTGPSERIATEQIMNHSPDHDLHSRQELFTARQADSEIGKAQEMSMESVITQSSDLQVVASGSVAPSGTEHSEPTNLAMAICLENVSTGLLPIRTTQSELMEVDNNAITRNEQIETARFSIDPSQKDAEFKEQLQVAADFHHMQGLSMPSVKEESNDTYPSIIKNESDDSIRPICQNVKQEEECGQLPNLNNTTLRNSNTLYEQDGAGLSQTTEISSSRMLPARSANAEGFKMGKKPGSHQSSKKRKERDEEYENHDEKFWDDNFSRPGGTTSLEYHASTAPYKQTHHMRAMTKRQMIVVAVQRGDGDHDFYPRAGSGSSTRVSSHALNENFPIVPSKDSNFLKIVKGLNATHNVPTEVDLEKMTPLKANSKKQMFNRMLRASPKTSDARLNLLNIEALKDAVAYFGRKIRLVDDGWLINGMISLALLHHQVIGAAWMARREKSDSESKGGMLCDSMGLGKTVETIAAMLWNLPNKTERRKYERATLIIAAPTLLSQWKLELRKHASERAFEKITIYQAKKGEDRNIVASCDVLLVSYGEVIRSCPFPSPTEMSTLKKKDHTWDGTAESHDDESNLVARWIEESMQYCDDLHMVDWYRIIIDEAHKIKSHDAHLSHAVNALKGKHRWVLTGTPIMNRPEELYGYFRFLKEPNAKSFKMFKAKFTNIDKASLHFAPVCHMCIAKLVLQKPENMERLDSVLARTMIMRTMEDKFLGRPLVDLPRPHHNDLPLDFSQEEGIIYRAMEAKYVKTLIQCPDQEKPYDAAAHGSPKTNNQSPGGVSSNKDVKSRRPEFVLIGLHRLRQMTAHPLLVERYIQKDFDIPELRVLYQELLDLGRPQHLVTARIGVLLKQKEQGVTDYSDEEDECRFCSLCSDIAIDPCFIPACKHDFCKVCIEDYVKYQIEEAGEVESKCPECDVPFEVTSLKCAAPPKKSVKQPGQQKPKSKKKADRKPSRQPGEDSVGNLPPLVRMSWLDDFDSGGAMPPSSKLEALETHIKSRMASDPSEKQIIFTQWRSFAGVLGRALQRKRLSFVYLTGDMTPRARSDAVSKFSSNNNIKIMLATLKTAGEGLNLECANVVYSMDQWWNACSEKQAFCRVYRIGQKKETYFFRLILKKSVDERIIEMQDKKLEMIEQMLKPTVSRREMAQLFGVAHKDPKNDKPAGTSMDKNINQDDSDSEEADDDQHGQLGESESDSDSNDGFSD
ncbi:hypothetical protein VTL71DRAFT_437 [Oculimacula yallundae]|uniref:Uncharacterized protein n=1 Tax=Oculimacula yallundae TaxID=86028 RepID=A0ABR4D029_9HELO